MRYMVWVSGEQDVAADADVAGTTEGLCRAAWDKPWWEQPFVIVADDGRAAIAAVLLSGVMAGRDVNRATATPLPDAMLMPPFERDGVFGFEPS